MQVLKQVFQPSPSPLVMRHFTNQRNIPELLLCSGRRLGRRFASLHPVTHGRLKMAMNLLIELCLSPLSREKEPHVPLSLVPGFRTPAMASCNCSNASVPL